MDRSNRKKNEQLGMMYGKACHQLRKMILFRLAQSADMDVCFQCKKKIETVDSFSIEHKIPWLNSENPIGLFFDWGNIAFSHYLCNIGAHRIPHKKYHTKIEMRRANYLSSKKNGAAKRWKEKEKAKRRYRVCDGGVDNPSSL